MPDEKMVGRVIQTSRTGWGFISSKEIEFTKIFFHWTALQQNTLSFPEIRVGMIVEFTPIQLPDKRWRALNIRVMEREKFYASTEMPTLPE